MSAKNPAAFIVLIVNPENPSIQKILLKSQAFEVQ
jgi:hypothetical protein